MTGPRRTGAPRAGFTLVELLVAVVVASMLMAAIFQVLVSNQRIYTVQRDQILSQQTVRSGLQILAMELRELSVPGADLVTMADDEVEFRAQRRFGLACERTSVAPLQLRVLPRGERFQAGDVVFVFVEGDPDTPADDRWVEATVSATQPGPPCLPGQGSQLVTLDGVSALDAGDVRQGAPLRGYETRIYGAIPFDGATFVGQTLPSGEEVPFVGPILADGGVLFEYLGADGTQTATAADVRSIRITVRTGTAAGGPSGVEVGDALSTVVHLRN